MSSTNAVRGTYDLYGTEALKQQFIVQTAIKVCQRYGCEEMTTPIFEFSSVFQKSIGESTDIVGKEMYSFKDRGNEDLTLRPEGTAGVCRAFISNGLAQNIPLKLFYAGPMFRYERPQKGRFRQFNQFGVEYLGMGSPYSDVELISLANSILKELSIDNYVLEINTIGDMTSRNAYRQKLVDYFTKYEKDLSEDSKRRLQQNPLRILDSKEEKEQSMIVGAPPIDDSLTPEAKVFYEKVLNQLEMMGIGYKKNIKLVRGIDYYSHTVFEFKSSGLGAQDAILSGGRYNDLVKVMKGPDTPAVGFGAGIERLALLLNKTLTSPSPIVVIAIGESAESSAVKLAHDLRQSGFYIEMSFTGNLGKKMKKADQMGASSVIILGDDEVKAQKATVKNLKTGTQEIVSWDRLAAVLKNLGGVA